MASRMHCSQVPRAAALIFSLPAKRSRDTSQVSTGHSSRGSSPVKQAVSQVVSRRRGRELMRPQSRRLYRWLNMAMAMNNAARAL